MAPAMRSSPIGAASRPATFINAGTWIPRSSPRLNHAMQAFGKQKEGFSTWIARRVVVARRFSSPTA
jgi:hypothetical protein